MSEIDLDRVASLLRDRGYENAYVEQTGGGCATLYAGPTHDDPDWGTRYAVVAGPGWFEGPGWQNARADLEDFCYGADDGGEGPVQTIANGTEDEVAARLADFLEAVAS